MSKRQTRSSVSISAELATRLGVFALAHKLPVAQVVEQALDLLMSDATKVRPAVSSRMLGVQRHRSRRGLPPLGVKAPKVKATAPARIPVVVPRDPQVAADMAAMAKANVVAGLRPGVLEVSAETEELVCDRALRTGKAPDQLMDGAVGALLDEPERYPESWCRFCLEPAERCACRVRRAG